jgi:cytoskeletal protein CcmA (bactofilin family)
MIHRSGSVSGQLDYADIEIERGGQFKGNMIQHNNSTTQTGEPISVKK